MRGLSAILAMVVLTVVVLFCTTFGDAKGAHNRRRSEESSSSSEESNEGRSRRRGHSARGHHGGKRNDVRRSSESSESEEVRRPRPQGRGFWDDLGGLAKKAATNVYQKAKDTDWKAVGHKVQKVGSAAYTEAAKPNRKKRSYESNPLPAEQVLSDYVEDQEGPKSLYNKRSARKFDAKPYLHVKNQF